MEVEALAIDVIGSAQKQAGKAGGAVTALLYNSTSTNSTLHEFQNQIIGLIILLSFLSLGATMASRRVLQIGGGTVAVGAAYYLYSAGGNPSVAEKKLEHDASAAAARLRGQDVSKQEAQKKGELFAKEAGATIDRTVDNVRADIRNADQAINSKIHEAGNKVDQLKDEGSKALKDTSKELQQSADNFDKKVTQKTAEAKSGISSWLGFGK
ncbi:MAG: hypothetical protein Q9200_005834 [Gallowayella weberi]